MNGGLQSIGTPERILLILDLDETLIYATRTPLATPADFVAGPYRVYKRPYLETFLAACQEWFDIGVWTASSPNYAESIVREIFPEPEVLAFVWAGDRCTTVYDPDWGTYSTRKTLSKLRRRPQYAKYRREKILAVDDTPEKWLRSYGNLVPIRPFYGESEDAELPLLLRYLERLRFVENVRTVEKRGWRRQVLETIQ